jgi:ATP-dependent DNA ligase
MTTFLYEIRDPHSRVNDERASACAFDLLMLNGDDLRHRPYVRALRKLLRHGRGIQYVKHAEGHGDKLFNAACKLGLEGIVSKRVDAPYRSGPSRTWIRVKNPSAGSDASIRWNVLMVSSDTESCVGPQTHTDCKID